MEENYSMIATNFIIYDIHLKVYIKEHRNKFKYPEKRYKVFWKMELAGLRKQL